ncbi:MAG: molybdopterin molybdotransferase MoeA [Rhodoferax sp.]|uniref:molybdopterin molybdotransferase MoeA n=1 Tax=Rhodoferax sp. TaxID=50421 RepID=UPI002639B2C8|nr:gephyrin-like molybdotransferase Glp [Rhodoferax sp.]MDD2880637.1 molybdopterin molybdotransferase MoeA [Rhodoferax sp.]
MTTTRPAQKPLRSLDEALAQLLGYATELHGVEQVSTFDADGRVLAQDLVSALQVPPQDNSSMDGYAVRGADLADSSQSLPVSQRIAAGSSGEALASMSVARIFTGAPIPQGADAVVMQEDCDVQPDGSVRVQIVPQLGQWIRRAGEDVTRGAVVLTKGERLTPASLGLAASIGASQLAVVRRPKVALFSTGDELVMPGEVPPEHMKPGAIYNSNRFFLKALLVRLGCEVSDLGIVPDQRAATIDALRGAAEHHDLILTSGGVSVGEEDHIKPAVQSLGHLDLWQIAIKPGKPFAYGQIAQGAASASASGPACAPLAGGDSAAGAHFIGLPGNPVSSFVTFLLLVRPFLLKLQGVLDVAPNSVTVRADFTWSRADKRREFLRVRRNVAGGLELFTNQSSGVLTSVVWGDGLVDNPPGCTIAPGDVVRFIPFSELLA